MKKWAAIGLLVLSGLAWGVWQYRQTAAPLPVLDVAEVQQGDLLSAITATGSLQARRSVDIKFDGQDYIQRLYVNEGDHVRQGQIVACLETQLLNHARDGARQTLEKDEAGLAQAEANFHREESLWKEQLVARVEYDAARASYLAALHGRNADLEALRQVEEQIGRATLRSPLDGIVTGVYVHKGEMLGSATAVAAVGTASAVSKPTNTLMTIAAGGPLEVWADVNAADLGRVRRGLRAEISFDAFRPQVFHGRVVSIGLQPAVVNSVTTYRTIVAVEDATREMRIGMPANVIVLQPLARHQFLVPTTAIVGSADQVTVRVVQTQAAKDGRTVAHVFSVPVHPLARSNSLAAVIGPLQAGSLVLVGGQASADQACVLRRVHFPARPSLEGSPAETRLTQSSAGVLPASKRSGFLQRLFGL